MLVLCIQDQRLPTKKHVRSTYRNYRYQAPDAKPAPRQIQEGHVSWNSKSVNPVSYRISIAIPISYDNRQACNSPIGVIPNVS